MSIPDKLQGPGIKMEPRAVGTKTESGLLKLANGTLMARHATESGAREGADIDDRLEAAEAQMAELEAIRAEQTDKPKKTRSKKAKDEAVKIPVVPVVVTVEGIGEFSTQYVQICYGTGMLMLGLSAMSFVPQQATRTETGFTPIIRLSAYPDKRFIFTGNRITDNRGLVNIFLIEIPEEI